jgi:lysophospholipase
MGSVNSVACSWPCAGAAGAANATALCATSAIFRLALGAVDVVSADAAATPGGDYVEIAGAGHEILMEKNAIRAKFWEAFDDFVSKQDNEKTATG